MSDFLLDSFFGNPIHWCRLPFKKYIPHLWYFLWNRESCQQLDFSPRRNRLQNRVLEWATAKRSSRRNGKNAARVGIGGGRTTLEPRVVLKKKGMVSQGSLNVYQLRYLDDLRCKLISHCSWHPSITKPMTIKKRCFRLRLLVCHQNIFGFQRFFFRWTCTSIAGAHCRDSRQVSEESRLFFRWWSGFGMNVPLKFLAGLLAAIH